jgi:hypothetical protein
MRTPRTRLKSLTLWQGSSEESLSLRLGWVSIHTPGCYRLPVHWQLAGRILAWTVISAGLGGYAQRRPSCIFAICLSTLAEHESRTSYGTNFIEQLAPRGSWGLLDLTYLFDVRARHDIGRTSCIFQADVFFLFSSWAARLACM